MPLVVDYKEGHTDQRVRFTVELTQAKMQECLSEGLMSKFKLATKFSTSGYQAGGVPSQEGCDVTCGWGVVVGLRQRVV